MSPHLIRCHDCGIQRPSGSCYWPLCPHLPEAVRTGRKPRGPGAWEVGHGNGPTSRETASIGSDATGDRAKVVGEAEWLQEPYKQREGT